MAAGGEEPGDMDALQTLQRENARLRDEVARLSEALRAERAVSEGERGPERNHTGSTIQALREEARSFRALVENAGVGIANVEPWTGQFKLANPWYSRITGYSEAELLALTTADLTHPEDYARDQPIFERYVRGEFPTFETEKRYIRKDGSIVWVFVTARLVRDQAGHPIGSVAIVHDVTSRKEAEERLRERESHIQFVLTAADLGSWKLDLATGELETSDLCKRNFGLPPDADLPYERLVAMIHPEDRVAMQEAVDRAIATGCDYDTTYRITTPTGERRWIASRGRVAYDENGRAVRMAGITLDSTERMRAEEALRESEAIFRSMLDQMPSGVSIAEAPSGKLIYHNEEAIRLIRHPLLPTEDYMGYARYGALHDDDRPYAPEEYPIARALFGEVIHQQEMRYRRGDGTLTTLSVNAAPVRNARGEIVRTISTFHDISERKRAEEELRQAKEHAEEANRMKSVFLANMSHEIRTPLTGILGFADLLKGMVDGRAREYAERIERSGKRLNETLDAVLTLARLEAGRMEMVLESLDVPAETREVADMYRPDAVAKGLSLSITVAKKARRARAMLDRGAFTSILQNLISNAIKFTQRGGIHVTVDAEVASAPTRPEESAPCQDARVCIGVEDTGIGIAPDFLPRLFAPFMQESAGLTRSHGGTGLGLSIARQLAEKMGGTIDVESEKGEGSRFTLTFPLTREAAQDVRSLEYAASAADGHTNRRILVVEDHEDTRILIEALFQDTYDVTLCSNVADALESARRVVQAEGRPFDLVLVDVNLGEGPSGSELLRTLRRLHGYDEVPIAVMTAYALPGDAERLLKEGFDSYIRKPFSPDELLDTVARLIRHSNSRP